MSRKIYDIIPPEQQIEKHEEMAKECSAREPIKRERKKFPLIPFLLVIVLSLTAVFFFFPTRADVSITPKTEEITAEASFVINTTESIIDYEKKMVPGIIFSDKRDGADNYNSTGTDDKAKKATGTIKVFNKINPAKPLTLRIGTRFMVGELIYKSDSAFTIPKAVSDSAPGSIEIKVTAAEAGEKYNITKGTFSVPGLNGSEYYTNIWAELAIPMTGGEESKVKIVTSDDINRAKDQFEEKYDEVSKQALIATIPQGYTHFSEDISPKLSNLSVSVKAGDELDVFGVSGHIETEAIVFRNEDANKLGESLLSKDVSELKTMVPGSVTFEIKEKKLNKDGTISLKVVFSGKTYSMSEDTVLLNALKGKNPKDANSLLSNLPEVEKVEIKVSPWFKFSIPKNEKEINIQLKF
ncbi:MAG: baseplate J/gp47 family protein [Candidatus Paceibacterota bacterium]|jgi:hypothetical protein